MTRHFLDLASVGKDGLLEILDSADRFQAARGQPNSPRPLAGKSVVLIFEKASTRTHLSLEIAVAELGGHPVVLTPASSQLGRGEPIADTARVMSRMCHAVTLRTFGHERLIEFAKYSTVPVLNALTDSAHPMQLLADLQTVRRKKGKLSGLRYAWVGDGNNMARSWIEAAGLLGLELWLACPEGYDPPAAEVELARKRGGKVELVRDPRVAANAADVINTDVFASMGQEAEQAQRVKAFSGFIVDEQLLAVAHQDAIVLHCLPAHRGEEISAGVIDGPNSVVWDQAEARLHTAKAVLAWATQA